MTNTPALNEEDNILIRRAYSRLLRNMRKHIDQISREEQRMIRQAYELAVEAHSYQRRKSGEPYILHPIEVARICTQELGLGVISVTAALLHDVVEDTPVTLEDLKAQFGEQIAMIVDGLTKFGSITMKNEDDIASPQAENYKKILLTLAKDVRVVLIKLADRLHNMRTLGSMPHRKQVRIAYETSYIYAPLAHRLGFYTLKTELEDLCMKVIDHDRYNYIVQKLQETKSQRDRYVRRFIKPLKYRLRKKGLKFKIFGRSKSISSIARKLKNKAVPFEEIYDLFAVRIVLQTSPEKEKSMCWTAYSEVVDEYIPVPERHKDWISVPKANGYESLHITVMGPKGRFVEVQIRSDRMDEVAERGVAAHWKYKGIGKDHLFDEWLNKAREMLDGSESDAIDFLNDFRSNLFNEEVYVFTPKGEMRFFPKGSTALDFAFDIHSEVGYHCKAVKVSQRMVPISYELQNGDQVSVITKSDQKPTEDWLKIVKTGKARSRIRQALREEKRKQGAIGRETLLRKLKALKIIADDHNLDMLVKYYRFSSRLELFNAIYNEQIDLQEIKTLQVEQQKLLLEKKVVPEQRSAPPVEKISVIERDRNRMHFVGKPKLMIDGVDANTFSYELAPCCNPVQGDAVFAYFSGRHNVKIHRTTCPNAEHIQATYGYRIRRAEWVDSANLSFVADLLVTGMDDMGVIQQLTNTITNDLQVNMRSFSMTANNGYYEGRISLVVRNADQLNQIMNSIRQLSGVNSVARTE